MKYFNFGFIFSFFLFYSSSLLSLEGSPVNKKQIVQSLEKALLAHDVDKIQSLMRDEFATKYIVQQLDSSLRHIHSKNLDKIKTMLEVGVRPETPNPYYEAIKAEDMKICSLLHEFSVNPGRRDKEMFRSKFNIEDMTLHSPPSFLQKLSAMTLTQSMHQDIDQEIDEIYRQLSLKLKAAKNESIKKGKPLLILIGEQHKSLNSFFYELVILHLTREYNIDTLFTEAFPAKTYAKMQWTWSTAMAVEKMARQLKIHKQPVDLFTCHLVPEENVFAFEDCLKVPRRALSPEYDWLSPQGVEDRNQVMAKGIIHSEKSKDKMVIVGAGHLMGMERLLSPHFHVLPISVAKLGANRKAKSAYAKEAMDYAKSVELPSFKSLKKEVFISANIFVEKAQQGYERYTLLR